ncbi:stage II sporulation protein D [Niallia nealsonii]|uniref:Stage II sporulation protein D n=1 Tax=Niallia nealsonii TaxID=115979 RepID=A0A2N0YZZ1_9BACI|nr:stage II sporulation protein D [Niallia nealsonii]PKG22821.1 stage II sporulation protein D [Niallia nealsonii]
MIKIKPFIVLGVILFAITLLIPSILVLPFMEEKVSGKLGENVQEETIQPKKSSEPSVEVAVYREAQKKVEKLALDDYVAGVVASEMPADFEVEALKAQALTARTYIVKKLASGNSISLPQGAVVGDSVNYQVYKSSDELKKIWKASDYEWKMKKIKEAVKATSGQILTYDGTPIDATFFSTSNGYTENSSAIWPNDIPYLTSVASPWDKKSPKYNGRKVISVAEFEQKLGVTLSNSKAIGEITEKTEGKRVAKVNISGKVLTGKEIRTKLDLKSTDFTWVRKGNDIIITTEGYGHGVGMSQYGANGMAAEGKSYEDIVKYYYKGVQLSKADNLLAKYTARK